MAATEGRDPIEDMKIINRELAQYSPELAERPQIVVANKCDMVLYDEEPYCRDFEAYVKELRCQLFYVSAVTGEGIDEMLCAVEKALRDLPPIKVYEREITPEEEAAEAAVGVRETTVRREGGVFYVEGKWLYNFMGQINFDDYQSLSFFGRVLQKNGVIDLLREHGATDGDTVNIYDYEFDFVQ